MQDTHLVPFTIDQLKVTLKAIEALHTSLCSQIARGTKDPQVDEELNLLESIANSMDLILYKISS